jgi:hypothetical protein
MLMERHTRFEVKAFRRGKQRAPQESNGTSLRSSLVFLGGFGGKNPLNTLDYCSAADSLGILVRVPVLYGSI